MFMKNKTDNSLRVSLVVPPAAQERLDYNRLVLLQSNAQTIRDALIKMCAPLNTRERLELTQARRKGAGL